METVKVKFSTQIENTRKLIHPIVLDRLRGNEVDEDGDFVAPITTTIALLQAGMVLLLSDIKANHDEVDEDSAINAVIGLTMDVMKKSVEQCLGVSMRTDFAAVGSKNAVDAHAVLDEAKAIVVARKEKADMAAMDEGIKGDHNNIADLLTNLQKRTKH